ncbi:phenylacetate--CoA ligase family protein [Desulfonatronovibrio hydrogenovorans]|uniref:phenylacetate--CoA ligase family protein n=1 Tax=Desulfonatronovibrio hydrogenovorans TaxID=53245 RepID=UPI00048B6994|nr:phenylacetate--CoA ligase [Desulfonatronovibrio hydrogenovorans]
MKYYDRIEFADQDEIRRIQGIRLKNTVYQATASRFYRGKLAMAGIRVSSVNQAEDITSLPFTTKEDLRANYPDGLLTMPVDRMVRLHASSGTTGAATVIYHTSNDLNSWAGLVARSMHAAGVRSWDVFQNMSGYGLFTGGLGIHYGAERLGCLTIPAGAGNSKRQIKMLKDFKVTVAHIIPSYALHLGSVFDDLGINPRSLQLKIMLIGAEPHSEEVRRRIEAIYGVKAYNSYGLSEMNGPGVAFECEAQSGMHLWEDSYLAEIVDPKTLEPVPDGEVGELVLTTLCREGMPIIRYRTRDLTRFIPGDCPCGRIHKRIDRITGRSDDMIVLKGVNIYPMQVEKVLMSIPEVGQNYVIELERKGYLDQMRVKVEIRDEFFVEDMRTLQALQQKIAGLLREEILITAKVDLVEHGSLPKNQGKAVRVVDKR